jgi:hypothetical protein
MHVKNDKIPFGNHALDINVGIGMLFLKPQEEVDEGLFSVSDERIVLYVSFAYE